MVSDPDQWAVGQLIQKARGKRKVREVAREAGISEGWLRQIERGYELTGGVKVPARPSDEILLRLAEVVGLDAGAIFAAAKRPFDGTGTTVARPIPDVEERLLKVEDAVADIHEDLREIRDLLAARKDAGSS